MKTNRLSLITTVLAKTFGVYLLVAANAAFAQGSFTPPGPLAA